MIQILNNLTRIAVLLNASKGISGEMPQKMDYIPFMI